MSGLSFISLRQVPLLRLLLPFLVGIILGCWKPEAFVGNVHGIILLGGAGLLIYFGWGRRTRSENLKWGFALYLWLLLFGCWRAANYNQLLKHDHFTAQVDMSEEARWFGKVESIRKGLHSYRLGIAVDSVLEDSVNAKKCRGKLLLYIPNDDRAAKLLLGQSIAFTARLDRLEPPLNPAAFDFAAWQARQNIFHRSSIQEPQWILLDDTPSLNGRAYLIRERLVEILKRYLPSDSNEFAVAAALILGKKDELSTELRNAYAETGAVHVLAVSGLHLGFIAWGLGLIFGWGPFKRKSWKWIRLACILCGIWLFALITGLPPSVQRAATMFSAVWIGIVLDRNSSVYNTLGASALLLLLIKPMLLFDIGFQLSYLALLGIIFFQPKIYAWLQPSSWLLDKLWALVCVALAAQLTTFPLSLYYFHQFPIYFLLSGVVVVLAASLILGTGILLFIFSWLPPLATLLGKVLFGILWGNNAFVASLQKLPAHLVDGIWINEWQLLALLLAVLLIAIYSVKLQAKYLMLALGALILVFSVNFWHQANLRQQKRLIIYHVYKATVVDGIDGRYRYTISDLEVGSLDLLWNVQPYREKVGATQIRKDSLHWKEAPPLYQFYEKKIVIVDNDWKPQTKPDGPARVDIILLTDAPQISLHDLSHYFQAAIWVADGTNYPANVNSWQKEAKDIGLKFHATREKGAYILDF